MEYKHREIEAKWQAYWANHKTFAAKADFKQAKYYVLDMFPYPSGAGLHVGHPLGYIASDIVARFKRHQGYNVMHPMGYDSFGLPAEQYAIQTGQHPSITTKANISRYREQLDKIGFSFDWDREVKTSDPAYYKWTQWIFIQLFNAWYNQDSNRAEAIDALIVKFKTNGNNGIKAACDETVKPFSAADWEAFNEKEKSDILLQYRLTYESYATVNWCPQLGTVLANEEVKDGVSERGGYPVVKKQMKQWSMRITAYAERLLQDLDTIDWSESIKEAQRNWIGKSEGCSLQFQVKDWKKTIEVFTTRIDTVFGVSFLTLAPEHELVAHITTDTQRAEVNAYIEQAKHRSERDRMADVKRVSGVFTGAYAIHPFTGHALPIWIGDYVLAGYGTGAVMAVPAHDVRDYAFAKHFNLPILEVVAGGDISEAAFDAKTGTIINSDFLNGLDVKSALKKGIAAVEQKQIGKGKINFRLRDAIFGRQRYWGEPIPIYYKVGIPYTVDEKDLPITLPEVDKYLPTEDGEPPLARAKDWKYKGQYDFELSTMPGWAGSSWYFLRYQDPHNTEQAFDTKKVDYWQNVDLYIGGSEHATGHLLYIRFWTKFLKDIGYLNFDEPAKKLINQGMIQGRSSFVYRINGTNQFVSYGLKDQYETTTLHVDVNIVENDVLDLEAFKNWRAEYKTAEFILENDKYQCGHEVEKMSKSKWNVVSPDDVCEKYGADTLRLYEMFLGPLEMAKPWNMNGISGVSGFLKKLWRLFYQQDQLMLSAAEPTKAELKTLHKTIKKITEDINAFSFNTSVSAFMIAVNELTELKCHTAEILKPLLVVLSPYAPHIAEELWSVCGAKHSIAFEPWPVLVPSYLEADVFAYPVSFNGKMRFNFELPIHLDKAEIEKLVMAAEQTQKYLDGKTPKKVIVVEKKIVNIVI